jgi:hypothetical protein
MIVEPAATLLREHIAKENNVLVRYGGTRSPARRQKLPAAAFADVDTWKIGEATSNRLFQIAESLRSQAARTVTSHHSNRWDP